MKLPKSIERLYYKHISIVRCSKCGGKLFNKGERAAGISKRCANKIEAHKVEQIAGTKDVLFFYTLPGNIVPSPYYTTLKECIEAMRAVKIANGHEIDYNVWTGDHSAPIKVDTHKEEIIK